MSLWRLILLKTRFYCLILQYLKERRDLIGSERSRLAQQTETESKRGMGFEKSRARQNYDNSIHLTPMWFAEE